MPTYLVLMVTHSVSVRRARMWALSQAVGEGFVIGHDPFTLALRL